MSLSPEEQAYRRGCHQTAAMIYDHLHRKSFSEREVRDFLGALEDTLRELREDRAWSGALLDEALARVSKKPGAS
jgi:hypothetical protein